MTYRCNPNYLYWVECRYFWIDRLVSNFGKGHFGHVVSVNYPLNSTKKGPTLAKYQTYNRTQVLEYIYLMYELDTTHL
jgi:hypothetical protein